MLNPQMIKNVNVITYCHKNHLILKKQLLVPRIQTITK